MTAVPSLPKDDKVGTFALLNDLLKVATEATMIAPEHKDTLMCSIAQFFRTESDKLSAHGDYCVTRRNLPASEKGGKGTSFLTLTKGRVRLLSAAGSYVGDANKVRWEETNSSAGKEPLREALSAIQTLPLAKTFEVA